MEEAFIAFRDLLQTKDIEEVENVGKMLFNKGLINKHVRLETRGGQKLF